ncbi:MAG: HpaII family restriction endonuclease [Bacteroidales bacterium]|nr:HpaII family restriction endonuclease [Bacteroidales bacterium]
MAKKSKSKSPKLIGNVGDWSEIYVLFRVLETGELQVADESLAPIPNSYYRVLEALRADSETQSDYIREDTNILIKVHYNNEGKEAEYSSLCPISIFAEMANWLLNLIKIQTKSPFKLPQLTPFLLSINIKKLKDIGHKRDITLKIEDCIRSMAQILGFSIKSYLGKDSSLFNAGKGTNFIYEVTFPEGVDINCDEFNSRTYNAKKQKGGKIGYRIREIYNLGGKIDFSSVQSDCLYNNLKMIDGDLPEILAYLILLKTMQGIGDLAKGTALLTERNPLHYNIGTHPHIYEFKIKKFLQDVAQGMTPEKAWNGNYDSTGGQIVVKDNGSIVCYHIYELNSFREYLFRNTRFDRPSTSEDENNPGNFRKGKNEKSFHYGILYKEGEKYFIKINLQIRYKKLSKRNSTKRSTRKANVRNAPKISGPTS